MENIFWATAFFYYNANTIDMDFSTWFLRFIYQNYKIISNWSKIKIN